VRSYADCGPGDFGLNNESSDDDDDDDDDDLDANFAADAIAGVSFYADNDPIDFGRFDRAFVGFLNVLGGESWFPGLDQVRGAC
jgi:hypothetical protein